MSRQIESITGAVRKKRNMPEGPRVSPTFMSTPYFFGISISCRHVPISPLSIVIITPSAPDNALALSVVASTVHGYCPAALILFTAFSIALSRSSFISIRDILTSLNASNVRISFTSSRVKPKLPAPINAIFFIVFTFNLPLTPRRSSNPRY